MSDSVWAEDSRPCPSCGSEAEPEQDGDTRYWACTDAECLMEFGYQRVPVSDPGACAIGVPEGVRRQFSSPADGSSPAVPITIGRRPPDA